MVYQWNSNLETGNELIDTQHQQLIEAINQLMEACSKGKGRDQLSTTSKFLLDYTQKHFADEEKLQKESGYPDIVKHKRYHAEFVKTVKDIAAELNRDGASIVMVGKINSAITLWLVNHITREDAKVAAHVRSKDA